MEDMAAATMATIRKSAAQKGKIPGSLTSVGTNQISVPNVLQNQLRIDADGEKAKEDDAEAHSGDPNALLHCGIVF